MLSPLEVRARAIESALRGMSLAQRCKRESYLGLRYVAFEHEVVNDIAETRLRASRMAMGSTQMVCDALADWRRKCLARLAKG